VVERLGIVAVVGAAAGTCEVRVTMTPGDVVGSVTERLLKVWVASAGDACEV
jgi:hypothetical protein